LAIVFGNNIRSRSLDSVRPGETAYAPRIIRSISVSPGRTLSKLRLRILFPNTMAKCRAESAAGMMTIRPVQPRRQSKSSRHLCASIRSVIISVSPGRTLSKLRLRILFPNTMAKCSFPSKSLWYPTAILHQTQAADVQHKSQVAKGPKLLSKLPAVEFVVEVQEHFRSIGSWDSRPHNTFHCWKLRK
jgi:hypothetical protein